MTDPLPGGAMPPAAGATPAQTPPAAPPASATPPSAPASPASPAPAAPAPSDDDGLGDAGKRALKAERDARAAAERERDETKRRLEELENASKSDHEKAIAAARKEATTEAQAKADTRIRRAEVRGALQAAGISPTELDLAAMAGEFGELKVSDAGDVEGLAEAVEAFRKGHPALFVKPGQATPPPISTDAGPRPPGTPKAANLEGAIANRYATSK